MKANELLELLSLENCSWDVAPARENGVIPSFPQPLDKPVPMVATADIGRVAAELLQETWNGRRVVELEGPSRVTPNEIAATFAELPGRATRMEAVARETCLWFPDRLPARQARRLDSLA